MNLMTKRVIVSITGMCLMCFIAIGLYLFLLTGTSNDKSTRVVTIDAGGISSIAKKLESDGFIRSANAFKVYMYTQSNRNLKAGTYKLSKSMGVRKIVKELQRGSKYNIEEVRLTFKEGKNIRGVAKVISENTNNSYEDVIGTLSDRSYAEGLISKYWFLSDEILNNGIYYPLEGYLFPNTYFFKNRNVSIDVIITTMLDEMGKQLEVYRDDISKSGLSIHKLITLASIVELEGASSNDRAKVAGVFYNRLNSGWNLGSDVTTYYALRIDDFSVSLSKEQGLYNCDNGYNTRCTSYIGLPVGPIDNPGIESIKSAIYPESHDYYYFVADCKGKTYLNKDENGHFATINKLKKENNWCA